MKILSIISSGYEQGGAETTVVSYNEAFRAMGHEVRTISSNSHADIPHFSDYEFEAIPTKGIKSILYTFFNPSAYRVTKKVLREFQPDVVLLHTMQQVTPSVLFALERYPTIQCVHGPEAFTTSLLAWHMNPSSFRNSDYNLNDLTITGKLRYALLRHVYVPYYKQCFRNISKFLVFSNYTREMLKRDGFTMKPIAYIPHGIELPRLSNTVKRQPNLIVYVGRLEKFKGVMDLVDAMPTVLKKFPGACLEIAGEGSHASVLKDRVEQLGIQHAVTFKGRISQANVAKLFAKATIVVTPSTWPEIFGRVGIEAMSLGTPVIATNVGGVQDWLQDGENGLLVKPGSPIQLSKAIIKLCSDTKLRSHISKHACESSKEFTTEKFVQHLLQLIRETIK